MEEEIKEQPLSKAKDDTLVVRYLEASMSNELLCKFPDHSAFDFDYSQSSIWSPLVPRFHSFKCLNPKSPDFVPKLSFDKISLSSRIKKKVCSFGLNLNSKLQKKKKTLKFNNDTSEFQSPPSKKGWKKVLKMTSKQFKRKKDHHQFHSRHPISRITLSDYLQSQNF